MSYWLNLGPAKNISDIVISVEPRRKTNRRTEDLKKKSHDARRIDEVLESRGQASVGELCDATGLLPERVLEHVNYLISNGYAKLGVRTSTGTTMPESGIEASASNKPPSPARRKVAADQNSSEELPANENYCEGAVIQVLKNHYERDTDAREACLKEFDYSYTCDVCEMSFSDDYGEIGEGYIHVHHRKPIATRKAEYRVNPAEDLVPVCPNCHAMLHYGTPWHLPRSTDELRAIVRKQRGKKQKRRG